MCSRCDASTEILAKSLPATTVACLRIVACSGKCMPVLPVALCIAGEFPVKVHVANKVLATIGARASEQDALCRTSTSEEKDRTKASM